MRSLGDVVAEPVQLEESRLALDPTECEVGIGLGLVRQGSLDSVDRISLTSSSTTSSSILSGGAEIGTRTLKTLKRGLGKLWRRHRGNASITEYDPSYKVAYLGNVLTGWAKGEGCVEKPVSTLWRNYVGSNRPDVSMRLTVTNGGLTATTKDHGLTEYWAHRVTYCTAPVSHPRLIVWVYRHEGRRLRPELRCHAALCSKESTARRLASVLNARLHQALLEFRRDKVSRQNARLSLANAVYENPSLPRRKILLSTGGINYRPPLERSKSAPKLSAIEEDAVAEEVEQQRFLEELRSLEHAARTWREQEGWRLARLLDALHRESSDENGSISSGCETASTANSEERVSGCEDSHLVQEPDLAHGQRASGRAEEDQQQQQAHEQQQQQQQQQQQPTAKRESLHPQGPNPGPRRNSEGSANFVACASSPRFRRRSSRGNRSRSRACKLVLAASGSGGFSLSRSEGEESLDEEEAEEEANHATLEEPGSPAVPACPPVGAAANFYGFESPDQDLDEIVDFRPHGESPRSSFSGPLPNVRLQTDSYAALIARREDVRKLIASRRVCTSRDDLDGCQDATNNPASNNICSKALKASTTTITTAPTRTRLASSASPSPPTFHTLGSLDEEEVDSDESGYVEASPKSSMDRTELKSRSKEELHKEAPAPVNGSEANPKVLPHEEALLVRNCQEQPSLAPGKAIGTEYPQPAEFIKCPISETIKKLANASLRHSRATRTGTEPRPGPRLESLVGCNKSATSKPELDGAGESPSLLQRKRLLAQHGVTV